MRRSCREVEPLIGRGPRALGDAERLVLEQHLTECPSCRRTSVMTRSVVELVHAAPANLGASARERAIGRALARKDVAVARPRLRERRGALAIALAAAAALLLWRLARDPGSPAPLAHGPSSNAPALSDVTARTPSESSPAPALAERMPSLGAATTPAGGEPATAAPSVEASAGARERNDVEASAGARERSDEIARGAEPALAAEASQGWFETSATERRAFAHAQVELAAGSRARFDQETRTLELERGRAEIDVDPRRGQGFSVVTQHFRVEVLGTQFAVSPDRVEVRRGRVEVFDRAGRVLARELGAGAKFAYTTQPAHQPAARRAGVRERSDVEARAGASNDAASLLERAREALAQTDLAAARELLQRAERGRLTRGERAELGTLRAECALAAHDAQAAIRAYLDVAQRFGELPAGENAAFAAAQLSARARADADAASTRRLFERYLERYPRGRFAAEARARLSTPAP